jgi:hypothetical protein
VQYTLGGLFARAANRNKALNRCAADNGCAGLTCTWDGKVCWGKNKLTGGKYHNDRYTWVAQRGWY